MNYSMYPRVKKAQQPTENYDQKLNAAIVKIQYTHADDWEVILDYIVSKSIMPEPLVVDTDSFLARKAAEKSAYIKIYRRLALVDKQ